MPSLKEKATGKSSKGSLAKTATRPENVAMPVQGSDPLMPEEGTAPMFNAPPPLLGPEYHYIKLFATIPGLRKKAGMGPM